MVTIVDNLNALQQRHMARFASMEGRALREFADAGQELMDKVVELHSGQPAGPTREQALRAWDHPFARRHGAALWPTPPVGVISGELVASLQFPFASPNPGEYSVTAKSVGTDHAQFVYSPTGTSKMVARGVVEAANDFAEARMHRLGKDLMAYQLRLL